MRPDARSVALLRGGLFLVMLATTVAAAPGCLRRKFDLCIEDPPHPDCPRDAGPDATADAPLTPDAAADAPADDASSTAADAFEPTDAP
jgi:hypothetical protein